MLDEAGLTFSMLHFSIASDAMSKHVSSKLRIDLSHTFFPHSVDTGRTAHTDFDGLLLHFLTL